jgi:transcriptional regulator with XRE-family HTH domain
MARPRKKRARPFGRVDENGTRVLTAGEAFAEQLRYVRERRALTLSDLADRLSELGLPYLNRVVLGKIEAGGTRAANVSLREVLAIAYALNVAPVLLMAPFAERATLEVAPNVAANYESGVARGWILGRWPLTDDDPADYFDLEAPEEREARRWQARAEAKDPRLSPLYRYTQLTPEQARARREVEEADRRLIDQARRERGEGR